MAQPVDSLKPTLLTFLEAVTDTFNTRLPGLKACEIHGGRFDVDELKRLSRQAPAIYLSALAVPGNTSIGDGRRHLDLQLTAFVVAKDRPRLPRDQAVLNMVESLLLLIPENLWGMAGACGLPKQVSARNLYSGTLDKTRTALWGISWRQVVNLGDDIWASDGTLPSEVYVGVEPETGLEHKDDYERIV